MSTVSDIFDLMRATQMNDWVGGSDPEIVGDASAAVANRLLNINSQSKVLDFGCGIGRVLVASMKVDPKPAEIVGMDIMPPVIDFCRTNIQPAFANTTFELLSDSNDHYDRFIDGTERKSKETMVEAYRDYFDAGYAFSVFTHVARADFASLLKFVGDMIAPGGRFLFTCFNLTQFSRHMIANEQAVFPFSQSKFVDNGEVFYGHEPDPLGFIAFDKALLESMVWEAGLVITTIEYGCWMGGAIGNSLHDMVVVTKPHALAAADDIEFVPTVSRENY